MPLIFEVFDAESGRLTSPDELYDGLLAEFDGLLDDHGAGHRADKPYLAALDRLLTKAPDFIDVYAYIASHWHRQGKPKKALDTALLGLNVSNRLIPEGFAGRIEWGHHDNRPHLGPFAGVRTPPSPQGHGHAYQTAGGVMINRV